MKNLIQVLFFFFVFFIYLQDSFAQTWTQVAHGAKLDTILAGEVRDIVLAAPGKYLAATDEGVYCSTDEGISWELVNLSISLYYPWSFYKHPDGRIFCGTLNGGLFVSPDSGTTWSHVAGHPSAASIQRITMDSQGRMFTGLYPFYSPYIGGVCRSTDNGTTWTKVLDTLSVEVVEVGPGDLLFAGTGPNTNSIRGLWRSTDAGTTWKSILNSFGIRSVTMAIDGSIITGVYYWTPTLQTHTYRSTDNGATWAQCGVFYAEFFAMDANHFVYAACDSGMRRSTNNGASWEAMNIGLLNRNGVVPWLRCLRKVGDNELIAGEYQTGEIFRSKDLGASWSAASALQTSQFISGKLVAIAPKDSSQLFLGSSLYGMLRWESAGGLIYINSGLSNLAVKSVYVGRTGYVFAGTAAGVYRSTNNGASWSKFGTPVVSIRAMTDLPSGELLAGATAGVIKFASDGSTYALMNTGLVNKCVNTFCTRSDERIFVGTEDGLYRLDNVTWVPMDVSASTLKVINIEVDMQTIAIATRDSSVFVSTNNGQLWQRNCAGIEGFAVKGLVLVAPDRLYVATEQNGTFAAIIGGTAWNPFTQGLNDLNMRGVVLSKDGYLYSITDSGAVFKTTSPVTDVREAISAVPKMFVLEQNYPNPFNPNTKISWQSPLGSWQTLKVYDVLGNKVVTLVDEYKPAGNYEVDFNARGLPSGVYFYQLNSDEFITTKKMVFLK